MAYTTIDDPEAYFQVITWNGNAGTNALTFDGETDMQPDLIWGKDRTLDRPFLADSVREKKSTGYYLFASNNNQADTSNAPLDGITAIGSNGFTLGANTNNAEGGWSYEINEDKDNGQGNSGKYVAWCWKESADSGFDIIAYTGSGSARTISHSLSAVPKVIIVKNRDAADSWQIYHGANTAAPETDYLVLETTAATVDAADRWNDTAPTSSVFSLGDGDEVNTNTEDYIAYAFAPKQGFSAMGSYTGNGNADGAYVHLGFLASWIMIKKTSGTESWHIFDRKRDVNENNIRLQANSTSGDDSTESGIDILANGFKCRTTWTGINATETYVYMAFAEAPFVNSNGVACLVSGPSAGVEYR